MTISELYSIYLKHPAVTTDSRNCPPDSLFFALKGDRFDGHAFVDNALQAGCAYAIVDNVAPTADKRVIVVDNVLHALQQLARIHRQTLGIPVIGITGTNGKTTTKELIAAVLSQKYIVLHTPGNLNNHIGVPLTLLRLKDKHEMAVIEMGANHPGEIAELSAIVLPDYGLITNVGYAHLEGFGSLEGVIKAKGELYDFLRTKNGTAFVHRDNEYLLPMAIGLNIIMYGASVFTEERFQIGRRAFDLFDKYNPVNSNAPFVGGKIKSLNPCLSFKWQNSPNEDYEVKTKLAGGYNMWNALAAITIGVFFDVPPEKINEAISAYQPTNNRSQFKKTKFNELIIDAYNANPSSMQAALENFTAMKPVQEDVKSGNMHDTGVEKPELPVNIPKAVILGDMRELGEKSPELHAEIINQVIACDFDKVLLCGDHFSSTGQQYVCFRIVEELCEYLRTNPLRGYYILVKGSRTIGLEKVIDYL